MCKYTISLKQHTPMIHFQSEVGATLRASELKPKLDKFLMEYGKLDEKYLSAKKRKALNYKVRINIDEQSVNSNEISTNKTLYFGNMGDAAKKRFSKIDGIISVEFFSYDAVLLTEIKRILPGFFLCTNFGTRQNKGFGSFYIANEQGKVTDINELKNILREYRQKFLYIEYQRNLKGEKFFSVINVIYKLMKGGINFPNTKTMQASYHKGFIYKYFLLKKIGNEKKFIKEKFFKVKQANGSEDEDRKYVRALLGVFSSITFRDRSNVEVCFHNEKIERFPSPITFKVIDHYLFVIPEKMRKEKEDEIDIFEQNFVLKTKNQSETIRTPSATDFDLWDFLMEFSKYFNEIKIENQPNMNSLERDLCDAKKAKLEVFNG